MKNSKPIQYLLFTLVAIIWGAIVYQVWAYLGKDEDQPLYTNRDYSPAEAVLVPDTFSLSLAYPDPFTGKTSTRSAKSGQRTVPASTKKNPSSSTPSILEEQPKVISPPKLIYQGYSINNSEVTRVRLQLNGKGITYRLDEEKEGIRVVAMSRDSVVILKEGDSFVFYRKGQ
ncbi:hypothetical protein [Lewinella sp. LCG006]|uniref:hypothetical protein n=1 Tax=Lewinella sp. LCG006 TaxID=3231911 RepID=UPI00345FDFC9